MVKRVRIGTSYASKRDDLPGGIFDAIGNSPRLWLNFTTANDTQSPFAETARGSKMVADDAPYPHPRPSLDLAAGADAGAFNARWRQEHRLFQAKPSPNKHDEFKHGVPTMSDDFDQKSRPAESLREGPLKAAIWRNEGRSGFYHTVTFARSYKDKDGSWRDTNTFRAQDMLGLSELARRAHHEVQDRDREAFKEKRRAAQTQERSRDDGHRR